jgi:hypothetical protein
MLFVLFLRIPVSLMNKLFYTLIVSELVRRYVNLQ